MTQLNVYITETAKYESLDPLDADSTVNLPVMRMLYFTPMMVNAKNELYSEVFDNFKYDENNFKIILQFKNDIGKFSDNSPITKNDVINSILRMAYERPTFPVIKDIDGIIPWSKLKNGISTWPAGVILQGDVLTIKLVKHNANALFRFCLELFSIIPTHCIDLKNNKLTCVRPPFSGYYEIVNENNNSVIFKQRNSKNKSPEVKNWSEIHFKYYNINQLNLEELKDNEIVFSKEQALIGFKNLSEDQLNWLPASRFGVIVFNPNIKPFNNRKFRIYFSDHVRSELKKEFPSLIFSKSIFTQLIPGYLDDSRFTTVDSIETSQKDNLAYMEYNSPISDKINSIVIEFAKMHKLSFKNLGNAFEVGDNEFLNGKAGYILLSSGFWPQDPIGDISMYFTKNLHKNLKFVWKDKKMYTLLESIENTKNSDEIKVKMEELNLHIHEEALIVPTIHYRRVIITKKNQRILKFPIAITAPAPWQITLEY